MPSQDARALAARRSGRVRVSVRPDLQTVRAGSSMNKAETLVYKGLVQQGWRGAPPVTAPILRPITQSIVREVLYTQYERMVNEQLPCVVLSGTDNDVVWSALQGHPRASQKIGTGISVLVVSRHDNHQQRKQPGFFVGQTDGTVVDFGMKKCIKHTLPVGDDTAWRETMERLIKTGDFMRL